MKLLALERDKPGATDADFAPHLKSEAAQAWVLYQQGFVRELYFRQDEHTAVLVLECSGTDEAKAILSTLPLVQKGLITFKLLPLVPYPGFERLFAGGH